MICNGNPKSSSNVPLTYNVWPAVIPVELSVILITVSARTTNTTVALSPIRPVEPGVPTNSASKLWNPTSAFGGMVMLTSTIPDASDVPVVEIVVPLRVTVTCTPTTAAPVLSNSSSLAFTSSPLSVLSFREGWFTPSIVGFTKVRTV